MKKDYFLEINMRNDGNAYCVKSAGGNLPFIWWYYNIYGDISSLLTTIEKQVYFIPDWLDFRRGIQRVGIINWVKQFFKAESHAVYNKQDKGPFTQQTKEMVWYALIRIKRLIRRERK